MLSWDVLEFSGGGFELAGARDVFRSWCSKNTFTQVEICFRHVNKFYFTTLYKGCIHKGSVDSTTCSIRPPYTLYDNYTHLYISMYLYTVYDYICFY